MAQLLSAGHMQCSGKGFRGFAANGPLLPRPARRRGHRHKNRHKRSHQRARVDQKQLNDVYLNTQADNFVESFVVCFMRIPRAAAAPRAAASRQKSMDVSLWREIKGFNALIQRDCSLAGAEKLIDEDCRQYSCDKTDLAPQVFRLYPSH